MASYEPILLMELNKYCRTRNITSESESHSAISLLLYHLPLLFFIFSKQLEPRLPCVYQYSTRLA